MGPKKRREQTQGHGSPSPEMPAQNGSFWKLNGQGCPISLDGLPVPGPKPAKKAPIEANVSLNAWNAFEPHKEKWELGSR